MQVKASAALELTHAFFAHLENTFYIILYNWPYMVTDENIVPKTNLST